MKNIIKISIRLFLIFIIFNFIHSFSVTVLNFINSFRINNHYEIQTSEFINALIPFFVIWVMCITVLIILWIKSEKISIKIIGENNPEDMNLSLNMENILSIGIILLSELVPKLIDYALKRMVLEQALRKIGLKPAFSIKSKVAVPKLQFWNSFKSLFNYRYHSKIIHLYCKLYC
ncbi:MAG: hypothetical protein LBK61_00190 [Spirochaetaceae bacterium]|jgi:hypothetical protein|nr:hypothetical protein [Spirochaetaceae bacterium]